VDAAVAALLPERVLELPQRVRRHRARLPRAGGVVDGEAVADVVARVAAQLLPNQLHDLQMEP
jgi:hypothetical protein